ncbi:MAG: glycosyltransferase family 2 protein [Simkaniaceae bacterium]|nr:glycosyltransferase family 2 protein [Simkaniaceae bacterium]
MLTWIGKIVYWFDHLNLFFFFFINSFYALLLILSFPSIHRRFKELQVEDIYRLLQSDSLPPIAVVVPVHNQESIIVDSVRSILELSYPSKEVVVVNDGSTDSSLQVLIDTFELEEIPIIHPQDLPSQPIRACYQSLQFPNMVVIDKENGGKGDALNCGINFATAPLFLGIDSDTLITRDALLRMVRPFLASDEIAAQGGTLRILNGCEYAHGKIQKIGIPKGFWEGVQVGEYLRAFLYGRLGWNYLGGNLIVSGAFGLFDKNAVVECGGYNVNTVGEDMELTVKVTKLMRPKHSGAIVYFIPDPVAWTEVPSTFLSLARQRERWHRGLIEVMVKYKSMLFNPKYGKTGMIAMPYMLFGEMLQCIIEVWGYIGVLLGIYLGVIDWYFFFMFFFITWGISIFLTIASLAMEITTFREYNMFQHLGRLAGYAIFENLGFRQAYLVWRLHAYWKYFTGSKQWSK